MVSETLNETVQLLLTNFPFQFCFRTDIKGAARTELLTRDVVIDVAAQIRVGRLLTAVCRRIVNSEPRRLIDQLRLKIFHQVTTAEAGEARVHALFLVIEMAFNLFHLARSPWA